jgi:hypothetical protein
MIAGCLSLYRCWLGRLAAASATRSTAAPTHTHTAHAHTHVHSLRMGDLHARARVFVRCHWQHCALLTRVGSRATCSLRHESVWKNTPFRAPTTPSFVMTKLRNLLRPRGAAMPQVGARARGASCIASPAYGLLLMSGASCARRLSGAACMAPPLDPHVSLPLQIIAALAIGLMLLCNTGASVSRAARGGDERLSLSAALLLASSGRVRALWPARSLGWCPCSWEVFGLRCMRHASHASKHPCAWPSPGHGRAWLAGQTRREHATAVACGLPPSRVGVGRKARTSCL